MIHFEEDNRMSFVQNVAQSMMSAARTAPKGRGRDTLTIATVSGETLEKVAVRMEHIANRDHLESFKRDAICLRNSQVAVLIGTSIEALGAETCGMCGFSSCKEKNYHADAPCAFNSMDLGIALGSALTVASQFHVDNRVMYTVGKAVEELELLGVGVRPIFGIPLSVSSKNPFFDRKNLLDDISRPQ